MRGRVKLVLLSAAVLCLAVGAVRLFAPVTGRVYAMSCGLDTGGVILE
jgi:hypothetical protein